MKTRIIVKILFDNFKTYQGVQYENYTYLGDLLNHISILNDYEVDEIICMNISKNPSFYTVPKIIKKISLECNAPLSVGGNINNLSNVKALFKNGADKIILNNLVYKRPDLINKISGIYGAQSVVVNLDYVETNNNYYLYNNSKKVIRKEFEVGSFIQNLLKLNFGELMFSSVTRDGTYLGLDYKFFNKFLKNIHKPLILAGGTKSLKDINNIQKKLKLSGIAVGSLFCFYGKKQGILRTYINNEERKKI